MRPNKETPKLDRPLPALPIRRKPASVFVAGVVPRVRSRDATQRMGGTSRPLRWVIGFTVLATTADALGCTFTVAEVLDGIGITLPEMRQADLQYLLFLPLLTAQPGDVPVSEKTVEVQSNSAWKPLQVDWDGAVHLPFREDSLTEITRLRVTPDCGRGLGVGVSLGARLPGRAERRISTGVLAGALREYKALRAQLPLLKRVFAPKVRAIRLLASGAAEMRCVVAGHPGQAKALEIYPDELEFGEWVDCPESIAHVRLTVESGAGKSR
jgi:hypothetical protein